MAVKNKAFDHWIETSASDEISGSPWMRDLARHIFEAGQGASNEALRKRCEAVEAMRFAGTLLSNIAFNLAQDDSLPETTRWSLDDARKRWDAVIAAAQEPSHG